MSMILVYRYLNYEVGIRCLKIKKLDIQHAQAKTTQLNNTGNQSLGLDPCKILNIGDIFIRQMPNCSLLCVEYSFVTI